MGGFGHVIPWLGRGVGDEDGWSTVALGGLDFAAELDWRITFKG